MEDKLKYIDVSEVVENINNAFDFNDILNKNKNYIEYLTSLCIKNNNITYNLIKRIDKIEEKSKSKKVLNSKKLGDNKIINEINNEKKHFETNFKSVDIKEDIIIDKQEAVIKSNNNYTKKDSIKTSFEINNNNNNQITDKISSEKHESDILINKDQENINNSLNEEIYSESEVCKCNINTITNNINILIKEKIAIFEADFNSKIVNDINSVADKLKVELNTKIANNTNDIVDIIDNKISTLKNKNIKHLETEVDTLNSFYNKIKSNISDVVNITEQNIKTQASKNNNLEELIVRIKKELENSINEIKERILINQQINENFTPMNMNKSNLNSTNSVNNNINNNELKDINDNLVSFVNNEFKKIHEFILKYNIENPKLLNDIKELSEFAKTINYMFNIDISSKEEAQVYKENLISIINNTFSNNIISYNEELNKINTVINSNYINTKERFNIILETINDISNNLSNKANKEEFDIKLNSLSKDVTNKIEINSEKIKSLENKTLHNYPVTHPSQNNLHKKKNTSLLNPNHTNNNSLNFDNINSPMSQSIYLEENNLTTNKLFNSKYIDTMKELCNNLFEYKIDEVFENYIKNSKYLCIEYKEKIINNSQEIENIFDLINTLNVKITQNEKTLDIIPDLNNKIFTINCELKNIDTKIAQVNELISNDLSDEVISVNENQKDDINNSIKKDSIKEKTSKFKFDFSNSVNNYNNKNISKKSDIKLLNKESLGKISTPLSYKTNQAFIMKELDSKIKELSLSIEKINDDLNIKIKREMIIEGGKVFDNFKYKLRQSLINIEDKLNYKADQINLEDIVKKLELKLTNELNHKIGSNELIKNNNNINKKINNIQSKISQTLVETLIDIQGDEVPLILKISNTNKSDKCGSCNQPVKHLKTEIDNVNIIENNENNIKINKFKKPLKSKTNNLIVENNNYKNPNKFKNKHYNKMYNSQYYINNLNNIKHQPYYSTGNYKQLEKVNNSKNINISNELPNINKNYKNNLDQSKKKFDEIVNEEIEKLKTNSKRIINAANTIAEKIK